MRPVSVRFKCFGPYMQEQYVNFEELERDGIFLICGETGAGKTTILDAICYALYGKSSGGLRGGLEVMRCALADSEDDTLVEFIFDSNGKRYRFTRSLKYKTEKNKKSRNLNDYHNCMELDGDREIPIIEKEQDRYVTQKAQELIGLDYDQFRQVIILPQGQFERLLVSDSEQKEEILVSLFHAQRWQKIAAEVFERVSARDGKLKEARRSIDETLHRYGCDSLSALGEKNQQQKEELENLLSQTQQAEQALEEAKQAKEQALLENQTFQELKKRKSRLEMLKDRETEFAREEAILADANQAETIRPQYQQYQTACAAFQRGRDNVRDAEITLQKKQQALTAAQLAQEVHDRERTSVDQKRLYIIQLQNAKQAYETLEERKNAVTSAQFAQETAQKAAEKARTALAQRSSAWLIAVENQEAALAAYKNIEKQYLIGIGAILAQKLEPGKACPVCGSTLHPDPAKQEQTHISDTQRGESMHAMERAMELAAEASRHKTQAEQEKQKAEQELMEAQRQTDIARTAYEEALSRRLEGIETEQQRAEQLELLQRQVRDYDAQDRELQTKLTGALAAQAAALHVAEAARQELAQAQERCEEQKALWQDALASSGLENLQRYLTADMEPEEKQRRSMQLHQFHADLESARKAVEEQMLELAGKTVPDLAGITAQLTAAEDHHRRCVTAQTLAAKQLEDMVSAYGQLSERLAVYEQQRVKVDSDLLFARRLRGDSGVSLQRYVLGVMMTSVTVEANRLLAGVYRGRYRLYRTDEVSGRKRKGGLELEVYDSHTNQRRSVTTLSGGEKFLVSLSLAIGLSTVVQAQGGGIRLEAMFIDEGFGSLDRESVADALDVLQGVRRGSGIVGIISHVEQLEEVIPTRLEITKGKKGSTCSLKN